MPLRVRRAGLPERRADGRRRHTATVRLRRRTGWQYRHLRRSDRDHHPGRLPRRRRLVGQLAADPGPASAPGAAAVAVATTPSASTIMKLDATDADRVGRRQVLQRHRRRLPEVPLRPVAELHGAEQARLRRRPATSWPATPTGSAGPERRSGASRACSARSATPPASPRSRTSASSCTRTHRHQRRSAARGLRPQPDRVRLARHRHLLQLPRHADGPDTGNPAAVIPVAGGDFAPTAKGLAPIANQFLNSPHAKYTGTSTTVDVITSRWVGRRAQDQLRQHLRRLHLPERQHAPCGAGSILTTVYQNGVARRIPNPRHPHQPGLHQRR